MATKMKRKKAATSNNYVMLVLFFFLFLPFSLILFTFVSLQRWHYSLATTPQDNDHQQQTPVETEISCDRSHREYDICVINGPTVLDSTESTLYAIGPTRPKNFMEKIRPHPRKWEPPVMALTKEVTMRSDPIGPKKCDVVHNATALVFSAGGYIGHFFHDFNEGFIPLFITVRSMSLSAQDVVLVIGKLKDSWATRYSHLLGEFSNHPIVDLDKDTNTHCFTSVVVGLYYHGFLTINPKLMPVPLRLAHFHSLLAKVYSQAHLPTHQEPTPRPRLVLLVRKGHVGRVLLNQDQVRAMAEDMGFDVAVFEPKVNTPIPESFGLLERSHVVVGVHGAAMTHLLFLRPGTVLIQAVPIGLDSVSELCYGKAAREIGLDYVEYKVGVEESSLIQKYNKSNPIFTDSIRMQEKRWPFVKMIYLKQQNVTLDLIRFRGYLETAYRRSMILMDRQG